MHFIRISNEASEQGSALQFVIPGYGRIARCVATALVTFVMFLLENAISVQIMILVSCVLAMILVVLLAVNDILVVKGASRSIDESLVVSELSEDIDLEEDMWSAFVQAYGFTDRECDVLEKLIHTENNLQEISEELFIALLKYHLVEIDDVLPEIKKGLEEKLEAMVRRDLYTKYKTAPTEEEREKARQEYLEKVGMHRSFRW